MENPPGHPGGEEANVDRLSATSPNDDAGAETTALSGPEPGRSRRAILAAALGGVAGTIATALGRPAAADAAAGDGMKVGLQNYAGSSATRLNATSSGGAFWVIQNGFGSGVRGEAIKGTGGVFVTAAANSYALIGQHSTSARGTGAAVRADGGPNDGVYASTTAVSGSAVRAQTSLPQGFSGANAVDATAIGGTGVRSYGSQYGVYATSASTGLFSSG